MLRCSRSAATRYSPYRSSQQLLTTGRVVIDLMPMLILDEGKREGAWDDEERSGTMTGGRET